jgi:hypothetical protein
MHLVYSVTARPGLTRSDLLRGRVLPIRELVLELVEYFLVFFIIRNEIKVGLPAIVLG